MSLLKDVNKYYLKTNFADYHLTNSKPRFLQTQLEFTLSRISGAFNALFWYDFWISTDFLSETKFESWKN